MKLLLILLISSIAFAEDLHEITYYSFPEAVARLREVREIKAKAVKSANDTILNSFLSQLNAEEKKEHLKYLENKKIERKLKIPQSTLERIKKNQIYKISSLKIGSKLDQLQSDLVFEKSIGSEKSRGIYNAAIFFEDSGQMLYPDNLEFTLVEFWFNKKNELGEIKIAAHFFSASSPMELLVVHSKAYDEAFVFDSCKLPHDYPEKVHRYAPNAKPGRSGWIVTKKRSKNIINPIVVNNCQTEDDKVVFPKKIKLCNSMRGVTC